jgi:hypothetical protein
MSSKNIITYASLAAFGGAVVATDCVSVDADHDNGAAFHGWGRSRRNWLASPVRRGLGDPGRGYSLPCISMRHHNM